jgi:hypothetical protein
MHSEKVDDSEATSQTPCSFSRSASGPDRGARRALSWAPPGVGVICVRPATTPDLAADSAVPGCHLVTLTYRIVRVALSSPRT